MLLTLCVHNRFLPYLALANGTAITSLEKSIHLEVLTETQEKFPFKHRSAGLSGATEYNQSLLALLRHARGKYVMFVDAADRLRTRPILKAIRLLERKANVVAVAGGLHNPDSDFLKKLAPQGVIMRREEACRFLHATEYDLLGCWHSLAQLARHGEVLCMKGYLSERRHLDSASFGQMDVRNYFFKVSSPERYLGELSLYDPVTLERYLSDAEKFLLFWPSFTAMYRHQRITHMFEKRAALYRAASEQAKNNGNATMHMHFRLRSKMLEYQPGGGSQAHQLPRMDAGESTLRQAVAEQLRLELSLLGEKMTFYVENASVFKAMEKRLDGIFIQWMDRKKLQTKAYSPDEVVVFHRNEDMRDRLRRIPQAQPRHHFSYEDIRRQLALA